MSCELVRHHKITCRVTYPTAKKTTGKLQMRIARGKHVVALGHAHVSRGVAHVTLREVRRISRGVGAMTLVLTQPHQTRSTTIEKVRVR